jgi:L-alanine-DL-glutamate epimerase-like enolase superfamily enzyme
VSPARVASVDVVPVDVPLQDPFVIARGAVATAACAFVRVTLDDGTSGYGEAAPFESLTGETRDGSVAALRRLGAVVAGTPLESPDPFAQRLTGAEPAEPAARCALECAVADARARSAGEPLFQHFGGADVREHTTDITLPILAEERIDQLAAGWYGKGFRTFKLKVGVDVDVEVRRVQRLAARYGDVRFILDANQGFDVTGAKSFIDSLAGLADRIDMIEQPVARADLAGMAALRGRGVAIAADESVFTREDARRVVADGAADIVNLKIMKSGLAETVVIAGIVREAGLRLMIGGMVETRLAMAFSFALVLGLGGIDFLDLDTPLLMGNDPLAGGYGYHGPRMRPWTESGVGMVPRTAFQSVG